MMINAPITGTASIDEEEIQDLVGTMFTGNTETGISIDYQDDDGTIDAVVAYGAEPGAVSSSTSGQAGSADTASRSDHCHDLGAHAHTGATSGGEIDGDILDIDWNPTNYVPNTTPAEASDIDDLTAHLYGIDEALGALGAPPTQEQIEDYVGAMVGGSSVQTNIAVSYDDTNGELDFEVEGVETVINVKDYGAVGDSTTDDYTAIQNAINAVDTNRGGRVYFPQGRYRIATGLVLTYPGTELIGEGQPGASIALGSSRILPDANVTAITGATGGTHLGYGIRRLSIVGPGSGTGKGIVISEASYTIIEDVTVRDFPSGAALTIDGDDTMMICSVIRNFGVGNCLKGVHLKGTAPNATTMYSGYIDCNDVASSIGVHVETGDTFRGFGIAVENCATGFYIESAAVGSELYGWRSEQCTLHVRIGASATNFSMFGGMLDSGGSDTGIQIDSGAKNITLMPSYINCSTNLTDNGTGTLMIWAGKAFSGLVTLTDEAPIAVDMSKGMNFIVTTSTDRTIANPSNAKEGQSGIFIIKGGDTITWGNQYYFPGGTAPDTTAGTCLVPYFCESSSVIHCGVGLEGMAITS